MVETVIDPDARFTQLQSLLRPARWPAGDGSEYRLGLAIPSISLDDATMARHPVVAPLEDRIIHLVLAMRTPWLRVALVTRGALAPEIVDYYMSLMPEAPDARERLDLVPVDAPGNRPLSEEILARPELVKRLRDLVGEDPSLAFIWPFNVGPAERDLAIAINAPLYGIDHRYAPLGYKSAGRKLFAELGIPCALGVEDVHTVDDLRAAIAALAPAGDVVVKLDQSVYGEGNIRLARDADPASLPPGYLRDLERFGGVVEAWLSGDEVRSPSVQLRVLPGGEPVVISTHDQILGGSNGQQFMACRFPADPGYGPQVIASAQRVGRRLAEAGLVGRFGMDFVVVRRPDGGWDHYAMELNLREGGTSHPYATLWFLTEGNFDAATGSYRMADGTTRAYVATDHLETGCRSVQELLRAATEAGVAFDPDTDLGAVFHMLRALPDGEVAVVTIGDSPADAQQRHDRLAAAVA